MRLIFRVSTLPAFYGTNRFITMDTQTCYQTLFLAAWIRFSTPHTIYWSPILIFCFHLCPGVKNGIFLETFVTKILYTFLIFLMCVKCPAQLILCLINILIILGEEYELWNFWLCNLATPIFDKIIFLNTVFILWLMRETFTTLQNKLQIYSSVCFNHHMYKLRQDNKT